MPDPEMNSVSVRMYRGLLGDCFLLTLRAEGERKFALIDCGVLQNVPSGSDLVADLPESVTKMVGRAGLLAVQAGPDLIRRVAKDVLETTEGHIHLLILTHEHFDHLSGFGFASEAFQDPKVKIDELWMAWTEDPNDEQARKLQARFTKGRQALAMAVKLRAKLADQADERLKATADIAAFMGLHAEPKNPSTAPKSTREMIDSMRWKARKTRYLEPGQVMGRAEGIGLKTYVLGPPRDEDKLRKDLPSTGAAKEVYLTGLDEAAAVLSAVSAVAAREGIRQRLDTKDGSVSLEKADLAPFAPHHLRGLEVTSSGDLRSKLATAYFDKEDQKYRQIEDEWASAAETLALKMDSDTNNTSLALAIELADGQILLFPGDAQVGNWLSWRSQTYPAKPKTGQAAVTIDDLLPRVVFYKVGHHGSHNATLKALGLEKMINVRLTAAIPVVKAVAAVQGKGRTMPGQGWEMPYGDLFEDLKARTNGRLVCGDGDPKEEQKAFAAAPKGADPPITVVHAPNGLWVELTIPTSHGP
jgi:beta-lactamase superfamily II metal-dependent hydrolase